MPQAKTINLLLNDGTLKGVISMEASSWNKGELYSAPRESVNDLISTDACSRHGVYLLLSEDMVYIGQASDLAQRIRQHIIGKAWWERVVILTTSDNSFNRGDLDYIEAFLIARASKVGRLDCENKTMGNRPNLRRFREVEIQQYLTEALFLLELIGINVFCEDQKQTKKKTGEELISSVVNSSESQRAIREKKEAIQFLKTNGVSILKNANYAKRQPNKEEFWINPRTKALDQDWELILNNQYTYEIIVLHIPGETFSMETAKPNGLAPRYDQAHIIDLNINSGTLIDRRSKCDFSPYITHRIKY